MNAILIDPSDNVVTLTEAVKSGTRVQWEGGEVDARDDVPFGHKVAILDLEEGAQVIKYGAPIGNLNGPVARGGLIHTEQLHERRTEQVLGAEE